MSGRDQHEHTVVFLVAPGDVLDERWEIQARIGQGAMGSVFRGRDLETDQTIAVKILAPEHCRKPKVLARFEREAELMLSLRHPNIIQLNGVGHRGALPYIVMEYLEGLTLADVLKRKGGKLTGGEAMAVVKQVSSGLSFIHHHKLVHRDIKPQNIFVSPGGRVTILDLGVVRDRSNPGLTKPGAMVGTPYYMSPEQIAGVTEIDKRTDVYALAAMTFELLVGRPPFLGSTNFEVLYAHKNTPVPDASTLAKGISRDVAKVLMRGMAKKPSDRPQSASEFYADLEAYFGSAEKVDPAKAFAFLQEEVDAAKAKERPRTGNKAAVTKALPAGSAVPLGTGKVRSTRATTLPLEALGHPPPNTAAGARHTSADVPMAASGDVELISSGENPEATEERSDVKTSPKRQVPVDGDTEVHINTGSQPRKADPNATVTESGELRVVTTLKGLTSPAALFVDERPQGQTPRSIAVLAGRHVVRVERKGCKPQKKEVVVEANKVALVRLELTPAKAR